MSDFKKLGMFKVEIDGKEVELAAIPQTAEVSRGAGLEYNKTFSACVKGGALLRVQLDNILKREEIWDEVKSKQYDDLLEQIQNNERKLAKGGIKLTDAREAAISLRVIRVTLRDLISERTELESNTAEGQSENARFNYIIANIVVYNDTEEKYFPSLEDYLNTSTDPVTVEIATKTAEILYGLGNKYEHSLPENKFLSQYNLINDDLRLVDKEGSLCDTNFNRIDEEGFRIDEEGNRIDLEGQPLDNDGQYDYGEEFTDFVDDIWIEKEPKTKKSRKPKAVPKASQEVEAKQEASQEVEASQEASQEASLEPEPAVDS